MDTDYIKFEVPVEVDQQHNIAESAKKVTLKVNVNKETSSSKQESYRAESVERDAYHQRITIGVCAMTEKTRAPPMQHILTHMAAQEYIGVIMFTNEMILDQPVENWPICDCLIAFFSKGFPLDKAVKYVELRKPMVFNDLEAQYDIMDRRQVYKILTENGIEVPKHVVLNRNPQERGDSFTGCSGDVQLSRRQVCCLLALAFLNAFNPPSSSGYQHFTLSGFVSFPFYASQEGKLLCLLHYFQRIQQAENKMEEEFLNVYIQVTRKQIADDAVKTWATCDAPLIAFESISDGMIEDASGCLQIDFANEYIGGGVLGMGNVQEEIRFVINPECLVSLLFCEAMHPLESILITGAEQFSSYSGYGGRFKFGAPFNDPNPIGEDHRRQVDIVAIDAIPFFYGSSEQYQRHAINRELNKAYCGFTHTACGDDPASRKMAPVATGNWGCGAFGGDKEMKTLLQWMAASRAGRPLRYYTFNDSNFSEIQKEVTKFLSDKKVTVQQLYDILITGNVSKGNVFSYIMEAV